MKKRVCVFACSPRGEKSSSLELVRLIEKDCNLEFRHIDLGREYKRLMHDEQAIDDMIHEIASSRAVVWAFGSYFMYLPSQALFAISSLALKKNGSVFKGKIAAGVVSSIKLGDDRALKAVRRLSEGLGMIWAGGFSAPGNPYFGYRGNQAYAGFLEPAPKVEKGISFFARGLEQAVLQGLGEPGRYRTLNNPVEIESLLPESHIFALPENRDKRFSKVKAVPECTVIIPERRRPYEELSGMVESKIDTRAERIYLDESDIRPCLGCYKCEQDPKGGCIQDDQAFSILNKLAAKSEKSPGNSRLIVLIAEQSYLHIDPKLKSLLDRSWSFAHSRYLERTYLLPVIVAHQSERFFLADYLNDVFTFCGARVLPALFFDRDLTKRRLGSSLDRVRDAVTGNIPFPGRFSSIGARLVLRDYVYLARPGLVLDYLNFRKRGFFDFPNRKLSKRASAEVLRLLMSSKRLRRLLVDYRRTFLDNKRRTS
ncbi:MAG: hypothetical protein GXP49_10800 [Deltaproteobacteria bacterium]|nr:hypothetical protein [Deltaproteobacteria bacterium]